MPARRREVGIVTVAAIRKVKGARQYLLGEKEAIFTLVGGKVRSAAAELLRQAHRKRLPVKAEVDTRAGVIHRIEELSERELEKFRRDRILVEKPEKTFRIDVSAIDPTRFNLAHYHRAAHCFRACKRIIPNYLMAKKIFDFCAKQTCSLGGPFSVSPCIPFQYVRDGCYARAHKMRWIITTKYHFCCEKIFSFAVYGNDTLAVRANKWGGCCVSWWYHVAPLVRMRLGPFVVLLVIDPGMFDKPVLLSTWLAAQQNKNCNPNAHVSLYSIQPGSAYTPAGGWTAFSTDPNYTATDAILIAYKNLLTC